MQADIGHRAPQRAELGLDAGDGGFDRGGVAHVAGQGPELVGAIGLGKLGAGLFQPFRAARGEGDLGALGQQRLRDRQADAAAGARDQHHPALQLQIHARSPYSSGGIWSG